MLLTCVSLYKFPDSSAVPYLPGMSMGAQRHIADIKVDDMSADSASAINLQYGTNTGASQAGFGPGRRDIVGQV